MKRLASLWRASTLRARLTWLLAVAALLIVGVSVTIELAALQRRTHVQAHSTAMEFAQSVYSLLQSVPSQYRVNLADLLISQNRKAQYGAALAEGGALLPELADEMAQQLRDGGHGAVDVVCSERRIEVEDDLSDPTGPRKGYEINVYMRPAGSAEWSLATVQFVSPPAVLALLVTAILDSAMTIGFLSVIMVVMRRMTRPLGLLARAADRMSHGEVVDPLAVQGSADIRTMILTFNRMSRTVSQTIAYQKSLLQSLGHDLKTPLGDARSALGKLAPSSDRDAVSGRIDRVESQLSSITAFTRATLRDGAIEKLDIGSLLEALVEDAQDRGAPIEGEFVSGVIVPARFHALSRALRNLMENAVRYGGATTVRLCSDESTVTIVIDDDGPGIDEAKLSSIFEPFTRLSNDPRGSGLGLAIARTIIIDHGGSLVLENRAEGGLRQSVRLARIST